MALSLVRLHVDESRAVLGWHMGFTLQAVRQMTLITLLGGPLELDGTVIRDNLKSRRVVDDGEFVPHEYRVEPYQYDEMIGTYVGVATGPESY